MRLEPALRAALRPAIGLAINKGGLPAWSPRALFAAGEQGAWYDPSDLSTLFQDSAGTTPVTAVGQPVGKMLDKSGRGNHAAQSTTTARPTLQQDSGGRYYLSFDGVDDALATAAIDFTGTDKMTAWAGAKKLSDATVGIIAEYGFGDAAPGGFTLNGPRNSNAPNFGIDLRNADDSALTRTTGNSYAAPFSAVVNAGLDYAQATAAAQISFRLNGVAANITISSGTPRTGPTFGSGVLVVGGRSAAYFNGRLYGLIVRGASSTAAQIASAERYLAGKSGVTL